MQLTVTPKVTPVEWHPALSLHAPRRDAAYIREHRREQIAPAYLKQKAHSLYVDRGLGFYLYINV